MVAETHFGRRPAKPLRPEIRFITLAGVALTFCLPLLELLVPTLPIYFNGKLYDEYLLSGTDRSVSDRIRIVDVDEQSLREHGQWPWPRYKIAAMLDRLSQAGAISISFDMMFPEKDRTSIAVIRDDLKKNLNLAVDLAADKPYPDNDRLLAESIAQSPTVLGYQFLFDEPAAESDCRLHPLNLAGATGPVAPLGFQWDAPFVTCNLPLLTDSARHSGFFNVSPDADGILRTVPMIMFHKGRLYPSLALATVLKALKIEEVGLKRHFDDYRLVLGRTEVPLDARAGLLVKFRGPGRSYRYYSASDLLSGKVGREEIADKIVLISTSAAGLKELRATPTDPLFPGVEVHATVVDNLITADFLSRPSSALGIEFLATVVCGILYVCIAVRGGALRTLWLAAVGVAGLFGGTLALFQLKGIYLSPIMPVMTLIADFAVLNLLKFWREEQKSRRQTRDLAQAQTAIIESLAALTETRDPETGGHIKRTQEYVRLLAEALRREPLFSRELTDETIAQLHQSAPLHDIGKVGVPDCILLKPDVLSAEEYEEMKKHALLGRQVIAAIQRKLGNRSFLATAHEIIYTHHEKWDGSGYPQGLKGEEIPLSGRLMAIADMYDALTSGRVYKEILPHAEAVRVMSEHAPTHFDPRIFKMFLEICAEFQLVARKHADGGA
jgi:adenylate cyclase